MDSNTFINALFLCLLNVSFMVAGIFLNAVLIINLCRSSQLRKKLCYFIIFVLSCCDLAVVAIYHPALILSIILWSMEIHYEEVQRILKYLCWILVGWSMLALLTLNVERFFALKYPFFHQTAVTKRRLTFFLAFLMFIQVGLSTFLYFQTEAFDHVLTNVFVLSLLFVFIFLNYNIFIITKLKRKDERVTPNIASDKESKRSKFNLKNTSTCSLAIACFFVCSFSKVIYSVSRLASTTSSRDRQVMLFNLWSPTLVVMNSTFNCLIFFWRNSILRRERMKVVKCFQSARS